MVLYEGLFFTEEEVDLIHSLEKTTLTRENDKLHCTFKYRPQKEEIFNNIIDKEFAVYLTGYANDGQNNGFQISLPKELENYYINYDEELNKLKIPHITASLSKGAKAVNTKNLEFIPLEKPIKIVGKFGLRIKEKKNNWKA